MKLRVNHPKLLVIILYFQCTSVPIVQANFNLYLSPAEVQKTLGLKSELYYVKEGVVNNYATGWTVKIPPTVHSINFEWQALSRKTVFYSIALLVNETAIKPPLPPLSPPSLNISLDGTVPRDASTFRLDLPCSGIVSAEVDVVININVTSSKGNQPPVILYLRRRKICLKGLTPLSHGSNSDGSSRDLLLPGIMGGSVFVLLFSFVIGLGFWKLKCSKTRPSKSVLGKDQRNLLTTHDSIDSKIGSLPSPCSITSPAGAIRVASSAYTIPSSFSVTSYASLYSVPTDILSSSDPKQNPNTVNSAAPTYDNSYCTIPACQINNINSQRPNTEPAFKYSKTPQLLLGFEPSHLDHCFRHFEIPREAIQVSKVLEEGTLGFLYQGFLQNGNRNAEKEILIKTLKTPTDMESIASMCQEGTRLAELQHSNVVSLAGVSYTNTSPPYLVYHGGSARNLKRYLRERLSPLPISVSIRLFVDSTKAIEFLHSNNILHCDISARNCLMSEDYHLRLTDSALTKDFFPEDYVSREERPIRWLAPEVISHSAETLASDVWSLGVLFWEIGSKSAVPYSDITWWRLLPLLQSGRRLHQPPLCPNEIYSVMQTCWSLVPSDRPSSTNISEFISKFQSQHDSFV